VCCAQPIVEAAIDDGAKSNCLPAPGGARSQEWGDHQLVELTVDEVEIGEASTKAQARPPHRPCVHEQAHGCDAARYAESSKEDPDDRGDLTGDFGVSRDQCHDTPVVSSNQPRDIPSAVVRDQRVAFQAERIDCCPDDGGVRLKVERGGRLGPPRAG
jgi:hypothetical protein